MEGPRRPPPNLPGLDNIDLDFLRLQLCGLGQVDLQHAIAIHGPHAISLHGHRQLDQPLELPVGPLDVEELLHLALILESPLAFDREQVGRDRHGDVLFAHARQLERQDEVVLGGVHIDRRHPRAASRSRRTAEEIVEETVYLALNIRDAERLPPVRGRKPERMPTLHRYWRPPWFFAGTSGRLFILSTHSLYQVSVMLSNNVRAEGESGLRGLGRLEVVVFRPCGRGAPGVSRWAWPSWSSASWPPRRATSCCSRWSGPAASRPASRVRTLRALSRGSSTSPGRGPAAQP